MVAESFETAVIPAFIRSDPSSDAAMRGLPPSTPPATDHRRRRERGGAEPEELATRGVPAPVAISSGTPPRRSPCCPTQSEHARCRLVRGS